MDGEQEVTHGRTRTEAKKLANRHVTLIALGGIIGSSLFIGSGNIIRSTGPAAIVSYLLGGLLVYLAMKMLGEMAAHRPAVGSFMDYAKHGLGDGASYLVGWLYWYFWVGVLAYEAVIGGDRAAVEALRRIGAIPAPPPEAPQRRVPQRVR